MYHSSKTGKDTLIINIYVFLYLQIYHICEGLDYHTINKKNIYKYKLKITIKLLSLFTSAIYFWTCCGYVAI